MGHDVHVTSSHRLGLFKVSVFLLIILSTIQQGFLTEGRKILKQSDSHQTVSDDKTIMMRAQIGSKPPRCEGRCSSCRHCEAIQVPTNPQVQKGKSNSSMVSSIASYGRGDSSNYKPMSWKCKCGNIIFNP